MPTVLVFDVQSLLDTPKGREILEIELGSVLGDKRIPKVVTAACPMYDMYVYQEFMPCFSALDQPYEFVLHGSTLLVLHSGE